MPKVEAHIVPSNVPEPTSVKRAQRRPPPARPREFYVHWQTGVCASAFERNPGLEISSLPVLVEEWAFIVPGAESLTG